MRLNKLLMKYKKLCIKASKVNELILREYELKYLDEDRKTCKQILNAMYGKSIYKDTDSIVDGMKYTE